MIDVLLVGGIFLVPLENEDGFFKVFFEVEGKAKGVVLSRDGVIALLDKVSSGRNRAWVRELRRNIDSKLVPENLQRFFLELLIATIFSPAESSLVRFAQKQKKNRT